MALRASQITRSGAITLRLPTRPGSAHRGAVCQGGGHPESFACLACDRKSADVVPCEQRHLMDWRWSPSLSLAGVTHGLHAAAGRPPPAPNLEAPRSPNMRQTTHTGAYWAGQLGSGWRFAALCRRVEYSTEVVASIRSATREGSGSCRAGPWRVRDGREYSQAIWHQVATT